MSELDELAQFERLRDARLQVHQALVELMPAQAIEATAQKLGLLQEGKIVVRNQTEKYVVLDYTLYSHRDNGLSLTQKYLAQAGSTLTPDQKLFAEASLQSRFRIFTIGNVVPNLGVNVRDALTADTLFIKDQAFSHTFPPGTTLVGRIVEFPNFAITTGVAIPLLESTVPFLLYKVHAFFGQKSFQPLDEQDNLKIQLLVLQLCFAAFAAT